MIRHGLGQGFHGPAGRAIGRVLGHQLHQEQNVVVVIDDGASRALLVFEAGQAELLVALPPDADLVVVQIDQLADGPVRLAVGHEQDHPCPLGCPSLDGVGPHPCLELGTVTSSEFEWRESHPSMKSHQCYYREDALATILECAPCQWMVSFEYLSSC